MRSAQSLRRCAVGTHVLRVVEQGQTFLRGHRDRLPTHAVKHLGTADDLTLHFHFTFAHERQAQMGQRHEVARSTERALTIDHGRDVIVEEVDKALHSVELAAAIAIAERLHLEQQHDAHDVLRGALADATGMTLDEIDLKLRQLFLTDADLAE